MPNLIFSEKKKKKKKKKQESSIIILLGTLRAEIKPKFASFYCQYTFTMFYNLLMITDI